MSKNIINYTEIFEHCDLVGEARKEFFESQREQGIHNWVFPWEEESCSHMAYFETDDGKTVIDEMWNKMYTDELDYSDVEVFSLTELAEEFGIKFDYEIA